MTTVLVEDQRPVGGLWTRHNTTEMGVSFPQRTIELVVMPYGRGAQVPWDGGRREVTEIIERGAFDGIERRANRIRANRDHQDQRTFGRATALYPSREEGLVAQVRVARTALGDETLELADDGCLDASAGFQVKPGGMSWENRTRYRVNKAFLVHIALVPDGAYGEHAGVLAVRQAETATLERPAAPNLAALRLQRLREEYERIDARYRV